MRTNVIQNIDWGYPSKSALIKAFKRLRKEGYRCKMNVRSGTAYESVQNKEKDMFLYCFKPSKSKSRYWHPTPDQKFYFKGDLDFIQGVLESEGLKMAYTHYRPEERWFCIYSFGR